MILEIEVTFTVGHFHGEEWPPSPARLFQALVAASHHGAHGLIHQAVRDEALRWLEHQEPPSIVVPEAVHQREHLMNYVPNNDDGFGVDPHVRAEKSMGGWVFPPSSPVTYQWQIGADANATKQADVIAAMSSLIAYVGRTVDLAYARGRFLDAELSANAVGRKRWQPTERAGGRWLAPSAGFLELLDRRFPRSVSAEPPDFTNTRQVSYEPEDVLRLGAPVAVFEMLRMDGRKLGFDPRDLRQPAGMVRNAMLRWADATPGIRAHFPADQLARFLQGHKSAAGRERSEGGHFAVVPLPSVNPPSFTADGWLRRVAVIGYGVTSPVDHELFEELTRGLHRRGVPPASVGPAGVQGRRHREPGCVHRAGRSHRTAGPRLSSPRLPGHHTAHSCRSHLPPPVGGASGAGPWSLHWVRTPHSRCCMTPHFGLGLFIPVADEKQ